MSKSLACPKCQGITVETVKHFLIDCPHYRQERHALQRKLSQNTTALSFLLISPVAVLPLLNSSMLQGGSRHSLVKMPTIKSTRTLSIMVNYDRQQTSSSSPSRKQHQTSTNKSSPRTMNNCPCLVYFNRQHRPKTPSPHLSLPAAAAAPPTPTLILVSLSPTSSSSPPPLPYQWLHFHRIHTFTNLLPFLQAS